MGKEITLNLDFFEKIIAHQCLTNKLYLATVVDYLHPNYFKNPGIKLVVSICKKFYQKRGSTPNPSEIKTYLNSGDETKLFQETLKSFKILDSKYNFDELIENTENFFKQKAIYNAVVKTAEDFNNEKTNPQVTLKTFEDACNISLVEDLGLDYLEEIDRHIEDLQQTYSFLSTGWKWLDDKLGGGFLTTGRALYVFAGQTNVGKSIVLSNLAVNIAAQGKKVLIITLEMPESIYAKRTSSHITQIAFREVVNQIDDVKESLIDYKNKHPNSKIIFKEFPPKMVTVNHIKAYIDKLKSKGIELDAVVLDYINLLKADIEEKSYERVKDITEKLRALTYVFKIPFISATQIGRQGYDEEPGLDDTGESIGLPQTVDAQFGLWQEHGDAELGVIKMNVMKNRFGVNHGTTQLKINYDTLSLEEENDYFDDNTEVNSLGSSLENLSINVN